MKDFFDMVRKYLGNLSQKQVDGFNVILAASRNVPITHRAYILATAWHETAATMQPVREGLRKSEEWRKQNLRYYPHYGRGYVQLTWDYNYAFADKKLHEAGILAPHESLVTNLDLALRPDVSAYIIVTGMSEGWFTKKKMQNYNNFTDMRKVVNGTDKAALIAAYAAYFLEALKSMKSETIIPPSPVIIQPKPSILEELFTMFMRIFSK